MKYRREIDGLRAAAVVPVIFFHAGIRAFGGGFIGVDVFFVISGYLITSLILLEKHNGTFTLAGFYERRARRILPALFLMLACCCPFAWFWMMPDDLRDFSQTMVAVSTFSSNILLWIKSGYFDSASELKPLLHTWTLAVEEQYYLLFPIFLILSWRFWRKWTVYILLAAAFISLAWAQWGSINQPQATFYLLQTRAWELLLGVFAALHLFAKDANKGEGSRPLLSQAAAVTGICMIAFAVFYFDRNTPFPGLYALVPTVGAVLVILYATPGTFVGNILGNRLLVGLGLLSYSAYLWHQPLLAFARIRIGSELNTPLRYVLSVAAVGLAYLSWRFVEIPFRRKHHFSRKFIVICAVAGSTAFATAGTYANYKNGFVNRLTPEQQEIYSYTKFDFSTLWREGKCFLAPEQKYSDFAAECQHTSSKSDVLVIWGDSHAAALTPGLRKLTPDVVQYTASACPPLMGIEFESRPHCKAINDFVLEEIKRLQPSRVFLHADWLAYERQDFARGILRTLAGIHAAAPRTHITVIGGVPQWWPSLPVVILRKHLRLDSEQFLQNPAFGQLSDIDSELRSIAHTNGAAFVSAVDSLCRSDGCQVTVKDSGRIQLMAWDRTHLTEAGSIFLAKKILDDQSSGTL
jgi:peptidoglycan/LPS O-acetylase OafA/YrhL